MSADSYVQSPFDAQSYNRYAYVRNNPLSYTDPSGQFWWFFAAVAAVIIAEDANIINTQTSQMILGIATAALLGPGGGLSFAGGGIGQAMIAGFASGFVGSGGNLQGGLQGMLSASLFYGAGGVGKPTDFITYAAHAGAGCVTAVAAGGRCGQGAMSAVAGKFATNYAPGDWNNAAKFVAATVSGGTASVIGGGKFANGAQSAAFGYLFNQVASSAARRAAALAACPICANSSASSNSDESGLGILPRDREAAQAQRMLMSVDQVNSGQIVYRVWGGGISSEMGQHWTMVDPQFAGGDYRNLAGLPDWNSGTNITIGRLIDTTGIVVGPAAPFHGNAGGWPQVFVPKPAAQIQVIESHTVLPPY